MLPGTRGRSLLWEVFGSRCVLSDMLNILGDGWKNNNRFAGIPVDKIAIFWIVVGERNEEGFQHQHVYNSVITCFPSTLFTAARGTRLRTCLSLTIDRENFWLKRLVRKYEIQTEKWYTFPLCWLYRLAAAVRFVVGFHHDLRWINLKRIQLIKESDNLELRWKIRGTISLAKLFLSEGQKQ